MPSKLHNRQEPKEGFTISIERIYKERHIIACHDYSKLTNQQMVSSHRIRKFIIEDINALEKKIEQIKKKQGDGNVKV